MKRNLDENYSIKDTKGGIAARGMQDSVDFNDPLRRIQKGGKKFIQGKHFNAIESQPDAFWDHSKPLVGERSKWGLVPIKHTQPTLKQQIRYHAASPFATFETETNPVDHYVPNKR